MQTKYSKAAEAKRDPFDRYAFLLLTSENLGSSSAGYIAAEEVKFLKFRFVCLSVHQPTSINELILLTEIYIIRNFPRDEKRNQIWTKTMNIYIYTILHLRADIM